MLESGRRWEQDARSRERGVSRERERERKKLVFSTSLPVAPKCREGRTVFFGFRACRRREKSFPPHPFARQLGSIDPFPALDAIASMSIAVQSAKARSERGRRDTSEPRAANAARKVSTTVAVDEEGRRRQQQAEESFCKSCYGRGRVGGGAKFSSLPSSNAQRPFASHRAGHPRNSSGHEGTRDDKEKMRRTILDGDAKTRSSSRNLANIPRLGRARSLVPSSALSR